MSQICAHSHYMQSSCVDVGCPTRKIWLLLLFKQLRSRAAAVWWGWKAVRLYLVPPDFRVQAFTLSCTSQPPGFLHCTQFHVSVCMELRHKCDSIESLIHELVSIDYVCVACVSRRVSVVRSLFYFPIHRAPQSIAHHFFCIPARPFPLFHSFHLFIFFHRSLYSLGVCVHQNIYVYASVLQKSSLVFYVMRRARGVSVAKRHANDEYQFERGLNKKCV